jgi:hypothetical protein
VVAQAPARDGISASWDGHDTLLVAQRGNVFTRLKDPRRSSRDSKRPPRSLTIGEGDEVCLCVGWVA